MATTHITGKMLLACTFGTTDVNKISNILKDKKGKKMTAEQKKKFSVACRK
jgi:hypothetical protein